MRGSEIGDPLHSTPRDQSGMRKSGHLISGAIEFTQIA